MFCDGDHWRPGIDIDIQIALALKIPYILFDDFNKEFDGVRQAFAQVQNRFAALKLYTKEHDGSDCLFVANLDVIKIQ